MDLTDLVPSLKRAVAAPGEFDTNYTEATDADLAGALADALAEAQLDGFLRSVVLDAAETSTDVDLTSAQQALVIMYAMARVVQARILNLRNRTRYKAGNVEAETEQSATVLVALLKDISARKAQVLDQARTGSLASAFAMVDLYVARSVDAGTYGAVGSYQGYGELR